LVPLELSDCFQNDLPTVINLGYKLIAKANLIRKQETTVDYGFILPAHFIRGRADTLIANGVSDSKNVSINFSSQGKYSNRFFLQ